VRRGRREWYSGGGGGVVCGVVKRRAMIIVIVLVPCALLGFSSWLLDLDTLLSSSCLPFFLFLCRPPSTLATSMPFLIAVLTLPPPPSSLITQAAPTDSNRQPARPSPPPSSSPLGLASSLRHGRCCYRCCHHQPLRHRGGRAR